jgi:SAM-dependent methyltransferase
MRPMKTGQPSINPQSGASADRWAPYIARYRNGEWRDRIVHDLVVEEARRVGPQATILDIGCGRGLDGDVPLQKSLASVAGRYIGIEPDPEIPLGDYFTETYRCRFEEAPLPPGSVDVATAVMVLEHLPEPQVFWDKLHEILAEGGVFFGLTVDARHPFCWASSWLERTGMKDLYLRLLIGERGAGRYENYPTYYRSNTPGDLSRQGHAFRELEAVNFSKVGQWNSYFPRPLHPVISMLDRRAIRAGKPGTLLLVRAMK